MNFTLNPQSEPDQISVSSLPSVTEFAAGDAGLTPSTSLFVETVLSVRHWNEHLFMNMIRELSADFHALGFNESFNSNPGHFVIEKAFVD